MPTETRLSKPGDLERPTAAKKTVGKALSVEADEKGSNTEEEEGFNADEEEGFDAEEEEGFYATEEEGFNANKEFNPAQEESDNDDGVESEDGDFVTPKALRKSQKTPSDFLDMSSAETEERNGAQESTADIQPHLKKTDIEWDLQTPQRIDLKAQRKGTRVFRKEVGQRRVVVARENTNKVRLIIRCSLIVIV